MLFQVPHHIESLIIYQKITSNILCKSEYNTNCQFKLQVLSMSICKQLLLQYAGNNYTSAVSPHHTLIPSTASIWIFDLGHTIILHDTEPDIYTCRAHLIYQFYCMLFMQLKPKAISVSAH